MFFRKAKKEDIEAIIELCLESISILAQHDYSERQIKVWNQKIKQRENWEKVVSQEFTVVAMIENKPVGFASLKDGNYFNYLYVHPAQSKKGLASELINRILKQAHLSSKSKITVHASETAKPKFEKFGFRTKKKEIHDLEGVIIHNYLMEL